MFVSGTPRPWYLSQDTSEAIDFCFRVLQEDGLPAPRSTSIPTVMAAYALPG